MDIWICDVLFFQLLMEMFVEGFWNNYVVMVALDSINLPFTFLLVLINIQLEILPDEWVVYIGVEDLLCKTST